MKKVLFFLLIILWAGNSFSQSIQITITGPGHDVEEGTAATYAVSATNPNLVSLSLLNFVPTITNGSVVSFTPAGKLKWTLVVQWDCLPLGDGLIHIDETYTSVYGEKTVQLLSYRNNNIPNFCVDVTHPIQNLTCGITPEPLNVLECAKFCETEYYFRYQWQEATVVGGVVGTFTDMPIQTNQAFYPPTSATPIAKCYRRISTFRILTPVGFQYYSVTSNNAFVTFFPNVDPGIINGTLYVYANDIAVVTETPATGGSCGGSYFYEWEMWTPSNPQWIVIGNAESFPSNISITEETHVRRKVTCGDVVYTNELTIHVSLPLDPGSISSTTVTNLPYGTVPTVTQVPALNGLCDPASYTYVWERRIENGSWEIFGYGVDYPVTGTIMGNTVVRRKVICGGQELYTNEISFTMQPYVSAYAENLNYIRVNDIKVEGINSWPQADNMLIGPKHQTTRYLGDNGQTLQEVSKQGSLKPGTTSGFDVLTNYQDFVIPFDDDALGRTAKIYLPYSTPTAIGYFKSNALTDQQSYIEQKYQEPVGSNLGYSTSIFDESPLNRVINTKLPGYYWNSNPAYQGISTVYDVSPGTEGVRIMTMDYNSGDMPVVGSTYPFGTLYKTIKKDENGKLVYQYTDNRGYVVLKKVQEKDGANIDMSGYTGWLSTYYVYDDFGRLRYTITPKGVESLIAAGWVFSTDIRDGYCFYQEYDPKGRVIKKHGPDAGETWMVYDNRDRLVLSQDANQRNRSPKPNQWAYNLYDNEDQIIATGLINDTRNLASMQSFVDGLNNNTVDVTVFTGTSEVIQAYNPVAGKDNGGNYYCGSCTASFVNTLDYMDKYNPGAKPFLQISNQDFASSNDASLESLNFYSKTSRTRGLKTGEKVRVLDGNYDNANETDDRFLLNNMYYDEKGRMLQLVSTNYFNGTDYSSFKNGFDDRLISTFIKHGYNGNDFDGMMIVKRFDYDLLGRDIKTSGIFTKVATDIGNVINYKTISSVQYDEMGRALQKKVGADPANPTDPIETLDFSYNIQGWLTGINKDYALAGIGSPSSNIDQWKRRFGFYLGYDNGDQKFSNSQWDGNLTGVIWRSQGDNKPRRFDYTYDNVRRFTHAAFTQRESPNDAATMWSAAKVDFSVNVGGFDANSNILSMTQSGIIPGSTAPTLLDDLTYSYYQFSNKLKSVSDNANALTSGKQGDFSDYTPSNNVDYNYDFNGNLKYDKNKAIIDNNAAVTDNDPASGILYNFLNLPEKITIKSKNRIDYIYDATGGLLAKTITPLSGSGNIVKTTYYDDAFVYEGTFDAGTNTPGPIELKYIADEEGKLRIMEPVSAWSGPNLSVNHLETVGNVELINSGSVHKWGVWDYFLKDHLSNTRMVLTEEKVTQQIHCSMNFNDSNHPSLETEENNTFGSSVMGSIRVPSGSTPWTTNGTSGVAKLLLNQTTGQGGMGPSVILKVMAGDNIIGQASYFYELPSGNSNNQSTVNTIVTTLLNTLSGNVAVSNPVKDNITSGYLSSPTNGPLQPFITNNQPTPPSNVPRAYLNYIFFDEQFNYVGSSSGAKLVQGSGSQIPLTFSQKVEKNGYVFVYLSNESTNVPVFFDDFDVIYERGAMLEDNAYYPYGLKMGGISSKTFQAPANPDQYQGSYTEFNEEAGYNEFELRTYDPQIGRFLQTDPYEQFTSPYIGMGGDPVNHVDEDGGFTGWIGAAIGAAAGGVAAYAIAKNNGAKGLGLIGATVGGAVLGAGIGYAIDITFCEEALNDAGSFFGNFRNFYGGLLGQENIHVRNTEHFVGTAGSCPSVIPIETPNVWDWVPMLPPGDGTITRIVRNCTDVYTWSSTDPSSNSYSLIGSAQILQRVITVPNPPPAVDPRLNPGLVLRPVNVRKKIDILTPSGNLRASTIPANTQVFDPNGNSPGPLYGNNGTARPAGLGSRVVVTPATLTSDPTYSQTNPATSQYNSRVNKVKFGYKISKCERVKKTYKRVLFFFKGRLQSAEVL